MKMAFPISVRSPRAKGSTAFTLLEVMLAVGIIGLVAISIYRFLETNLLAMQISTEQGSMQMETQGLMSVLQYELNNLPRTETGVILGEAHKFNDLASDEMQWTCGPGCGLFTKNASGEYKVTLVLKPVPRSNAFDFGVRRVPVDETLKLGDDDNWLHLMDGVKAVEIRYFDLRLNAWLEKWTDQNARPTLVRVRLWRTNDTDPYEKILSLPPTSAAAQQGQPAQPAQPVQPAPPALRIQR